MYEFAINAHTVPVLKPDVGNKAFTKINISGITTKINVMIKKGKIIKNLFFQVVSLMVLFPIP